MNGVNFKNFTMKFKRICPICGLEFETKVHNKKYCSKRCSADAKAQYIHPNGGCKCVICGYRADVLSHHLRIKHNISSDEYIWKYNLKKSDVISESAQKNISEAQKKSISPNKKRFTSENNPAKNHNGRYSPFSMNFIKYDGLSDDEKHRLIDELKTRKCEYFKDNPQKNCTNIKFYLAKGMSETDARIALTNRQRTFTKEKCIERYGKPDGLKIWKERQEKWQNTLNSKTDEEKTEILMKRLNWMKTTSSRPEKELYECLKNIIGDELETQFRIQHNDHGFIFDIRYRNKLIEFNGDYWHCNPQIYNEYDEVNFPDGRKMALDVWTRDEKKTRIANENGFSVLVVWESDYKKNKEDEIKRCLKYLKDE